MAWTQNGKRQLKIHPIKSRRFCWSRCLLSIQPSITRASTLYLSDDERRCSIVYTHSTQHTHTSSSASRTMNSQKLLLSSELIETSGTSGGTTLCVVIVHNFGVRQFHRGDARKKQMRMCAMHTYLEQRESVEAPTIRWIQSFENENFKQFQNGSQLTR